MSSSTSEDLVISIVQTADFNYVAPFVFSLKQSSYRGQIVIFASAMKGDAVARLEQQGVTVIPYPFVDKHFREIFFWPCWPLWRRFFAARFPSSAKERLAHVALPLFYRRHLLYLQFLREHRTKFKRVFLTDARDVYFQADPFSWPLADGLNFFLLDASHNVKTANLDQNWISNQFGRQDASAHLAKGVSCAGTTFGDTASILIYLERMIACSLESRKLRKITGGDDQGVHNYLIHEKLVPNINLLSNWHGPVLTTTPPMTLSEMRLNQDGQIINEAGKVIPVIHQYDRVPGLKEHLLSRLPTAK